MAGILTDKESQEEKQEDDEALEPNSYADNASAQKSSHPLWDDNDKTYRCTSCAWEVVDGMCQACLQRFGPYGRKSNYSVSLTCELRKMHNLQLSGRDAL